MKKSNKWFLLLLVILTSLSIRAQENEKKESTWTLKMNMPQLVDLFSFPTVQLGAEKKINDYFSVNAEVGLQLYNDAYSDTDTIFLKARGFKANIEGRIYFIKLFKPGYQKAAGGFYCGLQAFYRHNQYTSSLEYYKEYEEEIEDRKEYVDYLGVKKTGYGLNVTLGFQKKVGNHFIFEPYLGIGGLNRIVKNSNREYNRYIHNLEDGLHFSEYYDFMDTSESSGWIVNFTMGFRLGYRL